MPLSGTSSLGSNVRRDLCSPPPLPIIGIKRTSFSQFKSGSVKVKMRQYRAVLGGREPEGMRQEARANVLGACATRRNRTQEVGDRREEKHERTLGTALPIHQ